MRLPAYAIILAGGYGTRVWPLSRRARPKQFLTGAKQLLALANQESLLQQTYRRVAPLFPAGKIYVVGNAEHRALMRRQLPRLPARQFLLEPFGRNTAAACALAAEHIRAVLPRGQRDAALAVFPADQAIRQQARFRRAVAAALAAATAEEVIVVLGVPPKGPYTLYGYIERGQALGRVRGQRIFRVRRFTEKPDERTAARYLRAGCYSWNSGMFFWRLSTFDQLLARYLPRTAATFRGLAPHIGGRSYPARLQRAYQRLQNISVDYALTQPAAARGQVRVLEPRLDWSDLGSWDAVYEWHAAGGKQDIVPGLNFLLDTRGNWFATPKKFVAAIGVRDLIAVDTPDALLLCSRRRSQEVGKIVDFLKKKGLRRLL